LQRLLRASPAGKFSNTQVGGLARLGLALIGLRVWAANRVIAGGPLTLVGGAIVEEAPATNALGAGIPASPSLPVALDAGQGLKEL
jgi:hypothetical protein